MSPHMAHKPESTNVRLLPKEYKQKVEARFTESFDTIKDPALKARAGIIYASITKFMNAEDWFDKYFLEFKELTEFLDKERNQSILDIIPEFDTWKI
jgi:hypothetical protein